MDFDNSKVYGENSISDGLVCLFVVCHICEWQRLIIAGDWINVCGWTECRDLGRADVYFQALTAGPWFIQCLHTAKQIEQSHQKLPHNMLACQISLKRTRTDSLTSVSQMVWGSIVLSALFLWNWTSSFSAVEDLSDFFILFLCVSTKRKFWSSWHWKVYISFIFHPLGCRFTRLTEVRQWQHFRF